MNKADSQALYLSETYCHKTGTRPPSCAKPRQLTIYEHTSILSLSVHMIIDTGNKDSAEYMKGM